MLQILMEQVVGYPPNYDKIKEAFDIENKPVVFCYGKYLYNPSGGIVPPDLIEHESTHCRQQNGDPEAWWDRYISDKNFRLAQEVEAYRNQYKYICRISNNRNEIFDFLKQISIDLSSSIYGNITTFTEAMNLIKG